MLDGSWMQPSHERWLDTEETVKLWAQAKSEVLLFLLPP